MPQSDDQVHVAKGAWVQDQELVLEDGSINAIFSAIVLLVMVTPLAAPPWLKVAISRQMKQEEAA
jgi:hypothetical protein